MIPSPRTKKAHSVSRAGRPVVLIRGLAGEDVDARHFTLDWCKRKSARDLAGCVSRVLENSAA